jgi:hypothetical protein
MRKLASANLVLIGVEQSDGVTLEIGDAAREREKRRATTAKAAYYWATG